jgi:hypothetical protein
MNIEHLNLRADIHRNLKNSGIEAVNDLITCTDKELLQIKGIGKITVKTIRKAIELYKKAYIHKDDQVLYTELFNRFIAEPITTISHDIQNINTIILELYRIIQSMQFEQKPDGILKYIDEKVPGFNAIIYDLYQSIKKE